MTSIRPIENIPDAERAIDLARDKTVVIYKHSPICSISDTAIQEFQDFAEGASGRAELFSVDVLAARPASLKIEERTGIRHESPQVLVLKNGAVTWHASHRRVRAEALRAQTGEQTSSES